MQDSVLPASTLNHEIHKSGSEESFTVIISEEQKQQELVWYPKLLHHPHTTLVVIRAFNVRNTIRILQISQVSIQWVKHSLCQTELAGLESPLHEQFLTWSQQKANTLPFMTSHMLQCLLLPLKKTTAVNYRHPNPTSTLHAALKQTPCELEQPFVSAFVH